MLSEKYLRTLCDVHDFDFAKLPGSEVFVLTVESARVCILEKSARLYWFMSIGSLSSIASERERVCKLLLEFSLSISSTFRSGVTLEDGNVLIFYQLEKSNVDYVKFELATEGFLNVLDWFNDRLGPRALTD